MTTEDYVSFETAKLLKEKGFYQEFFSDTTPVWVVKYKTQLVFHGDCDYPCESDEWYSAPVHQVVIRWLREFHHVFIVIDYEYECDSTPYYFKIYRLGENGKPERVEIKGVSYDKDNNPTEHIVGYRDWERSKKSFSTYIEAVEAAIKYCLINLI